MSNTAIPPSDKSVYTDVSSLAPHTGQSVTSEFYTGATQCSGDTNTVTTDDATRVISNIKKKPIVTKHDTAHIDTTAELQELQERKSNEEMRRTFVIDRVTESANSSPEKAIHQTIESYDDDDEEHQGMHLTLNSYIQSCPKPDMDSKQRPVSSLERLLRRRHLQIIVAVVVLIAIIIGVVVGSGGGGGKKGKGYGPRPLREEFLPVLYEVSTQSNLNNVESPQYQALTWVVESDPKRMLPSDKDALLQRYITTVFYYALGGEDWWLADNWLEVEHECKWHGITCNSKNEIVEIKLPSNKLKGILPDEIASMRQLSRLEADNNEISGSLPSSIGFLNNLKVLVLDDNRVQGTLPDVLLENSLLQVLNITDNELTGVIPSSIGYLSSISAISLAGNSLSGVLPQEFGKLINLLLLDVQSNNLVDSIPSSFGTMKALTYLSISHNSISGTIPSELGMLTNIVTLRMAGNKLEGTVPGTLGNLEKLNLLQLNDNNLTGEVPQEVCGVEIESLWADCGSEGNEIRQSNITCSCCQICF